MMKKADMHVHSNYSNDPSEWALRQIGMNECYIEVEEVYARAKAKGMDYVIITDHNTVDGAVRLNRKYPEDTIIGVEVTTGFPEDGCKMHVLLFDITAEQYRHIEKIRHNIYTLREYIIENDIGYSVAHATYAVNGRLNMEVFEKLILMFDVFEGINGARNPYFNEVWMDGLRNLTPEDIDRMYQKHKIEPISRDPWVKGFTGGSDDHAGLFSADTWTECEANTKAEFIAAIKNKHSLAMGRSNNYKTMAYVFYKIYNDFLLHSNNKNQNRVLKIITDIVFRDEAPKLKDAYIIHRMKVSSKKRERILARFIDRLETQILHQNIKLEDRINAVYDNICRLGDEYLKYFIKRFHKDMDRGNVFKAINNLTSLVPMAYMTLPFSSTWMHLNKDRKLLERFKNAYARTKRDEKGKVFWFTDTFVDLNGVSKTINNMLRAAREHDIPLHVVTSHKNLDNEPCEHQNVINLPTHFSFTPEIYNTYTMHFPSFLRSVEIIERENPQEIIISTPGPVGLIGLLAARLLGIKCKGIYHSDFGAQFDYIMGDGYSPRMIERYTNWFFNQVDELRVPTKEYIDILSRKNMREDKMTVFKRGIDTDLFRFDLSEKQTTLCQYAIPEGFNLIYAGRISKDKNLDFLAKVYREVVQTREDVNLIIAGNGPALAHLREEFAGNARVVFTGQVESTELAKLYSSSDLLLFPSTTDTFGMVVLEAQSCGLLALVTDVGGPQEIIVDQETGFVLPVDHSRLWVDKILSLIKVSEFTPESYVSMRNKASERVKQIFSMEKSLENLLGFNILAGREQDMVVANEPRRILLDVLDKMGEEDVSAK
ncbi:MAG: glycosyltransferase [Candidatus Omnitrophica bacterium]|nr:glycosyltransferase [Candidatus Omnitrophota bacterium]MCB9720388.1 glycosyltransferase [Candidatus Omnitrophota bacterium]